VRYRYSLQGDRCCWPLVPVRWMWCGGSVAAGWRATLV